MDAVRVLKDYTDREKGAYLGAIASLATADHAATQEELEHIEDLAETADISDVQKKMVLNAASEITGEELKRCLEILRTSELRFSLITELISFAKADGNYAEEEKSKIEQIASQVGVNEKQFSLLDHFVDKSNENIGQPAETSKPEFLESLGLSDKFKENGIDLQSLQKGLLGLAAPFLLASLFKGSRTRFGGMNSRMGGLGGGLGSILSGLSMGRGYGNTGGLLSRILGRNS